MNSEPLPSSLARRLARGAAAAVYTLLFRLARRVAIEPAPELEPDAARMPDPIFFLMAVEAARRAGWPR